MSVKISTSDDFAAWAKDMTAITPIVCLHGNQLHIYSKRALLDEWHSFKLFCHETYVDKSADIVNWLNKKVDDPEDYATYMSEAAGLIIADSDGNGKVLLNYMHDHFLLNKVFPEHPDVFWTFLNKEGKRVCSSDGNLRCMIYDRFKERMLEETKHRISLIVDDPGKLSPEEITTACERFGFKLDIFKRSLGIYAYEEILEKYFNDHGNDARRSLRKISVLRRLLLDSSQNLSEWDAAAQTLIAEESNQEFLNKVALYQAKINIAWAKMADNDPEQYEQYLRKGKVYHAMQQLGNSCRTVTVTANIPAYLTTFDRENNITHMIPVSGIKVEADRLRNLSSYLDEIYVKIPDEAFDRCYQCECHMTTENITEIRFRKNVFVIE